MQILKFNQVLSQACGQSRLGNLCLGSYRWRQVRYYLSSSGSLFSNAKDGEGGGSSGKTDAVLKKKYSDTLQLPKSKFAMKIPHEKRNEHEIKLADDLQFDQLYSLQRLWRQEQPEFILHDGPPYANGDVHIGHAVNKILKDITNRYKLLRGFKINYIPGWDCHGLPIELKVLKSDFGSSNKKNLQPIEIRESARKTVESSIEGQRESFRRWGVMAEWNNVYRTLDKSLLQAELRAFHNLYNKGLIYRDLKPVYWSPSSRTCLAEFELEYIPNHTSPSVYLTFDLTSDLHTLASSIGKGVENLENGPVKAVIWTTTPWTLPSNKAVAFNETLEYSVLQYTHRTEKSYLIVASNLAKDFSGQTMRSYIPIFTFPGSQLANFQYLHPWFDGQVCPFLHGNHVAGDKGTGLVHTAPAHGHDDFVLGLKHNLSMDCYVNNDGNFDNQLDGLKGLPVLSGGNKAVINKLKNKVLKETTIEHSYPIDWRTKKPVIIKTSLQWFLDTEKLKAPSLEQLENVGIYPLNVQNAMQSMVSSRPFWCISRQRSWGVPIPILYYKDSGKPYITEELVNEMNKLIETTGGVDFWWKVPVSELVKDESLAAQLEKSTDIFDIWLDSGLTWQILGDKVADLYLEGQDQFQGWFQSSLLTSVGLRGCAPYKNLYVHGFVVDDEGRKMSKSLGNVVDPKALISGSKETRQPAFGADVLRWWVAAQGSADGCNIAISNSLLRASDDGLQKLRNTLRFLISFCNEESIAEMDINTISYDELMHTDQYMLKVLKDFQREVTGFYETMNYHRVLMKALHFATTEVSAHYLTWTKDRLYCDYKMSQSRKSCIYVLNQLYLTFAKVLAPIFPFLIEESYSHYQLGTGHTSIFKSLWFDVNDTQWDNEQISSMFDLVLDIRTSLNHIIGANNPKDIWVELVCNPDAYKKLQLLHPGIESDVADKCDSELCDLLQVSGVDLKLFEGNTITDADGITSVNFSINPAGVSHSIAGFSAGISKTEMNQCARCRRFCCVEGNVLCSRCMSVMQRILRKQSHDEQLLPNSNDDEVRRTMSKNT